MTFPDSPFPRLNPKQSQEHTAFVSAARAAFIRMEAKKTGAYFTVYRGTDHKWYWNSRNAGNHEIEAYGNQGYENKQDYLETVAKYRRAFPGAPVTIRD